MDPCALRRVEQWRNAEEENGEDSPPKICKPVWLEWLDQWSVDNSRITRSTMTITMRISQYFFS